ncbi:bifunctional hydroxymethylpyrimidine kinase/phosphomethylpyrimidine kinase [Ectothiorhodospira mobilis]|uniref:hydroxymethylpyrimidine kinase n=1 Tax=Ectothiorhodospira mobilis TaxID=195064 RepID=A0A1I4P5W2_ECTMO|nr:hydroxymethylpyrimidine/phosphomethylpyrimidine kinase [Ectothiorhodospira mobilis]MCG5535597.1 hydroxymethylpyrimidine/phosphomethylpyrimidine kinase [Ectothiorhodospira mobilis]SFM23181.1 hydroxymethylpyrimidine/phosphomethylpyrimidine kinase [Ectothiorhodospira mobilis]
MIMQPSVPIVMTLAGSDPTGGAGIQADIESILSMGGHAAPVITAVTVQDTRDVVALAPMDGELIIQQARTVLEDMPVAALKVGLLGSMEAVEALHALLNDYPELPLVLDPVLAAGGGAALADEEMVDGILQLLVPRTTVLTPNTLEARALARGSDTLDACAMALLDQGAEYVFITGTHERTSEVHNTLYGNHRRLEVFPVPRLEGEFHGSGCTLSAAIAALLAQGTAVPVAVHEAVSYTWHSLQAGRRLGMGQKLPNRLFWARDEADEDDTDDGPHEPH